MVSRIVRATLISLPALALTCALSFTANAQDDTPPPPKPKKVKRVAKAKKAATPTAPSEPEAKADSPSLVKASGGEGDSTPQGENLKFNTDSAPVNTDRHAPMTFKDSGDAPAGTPRYEYAETVPDEAGYKAYIGYPKHQLGIYAAPMSIGSKWTGNDGRGYNFTTSSTAYGLNYRLLVSPLWRMEVDYQHFTMKMNQQSVAPLTFQDSSVNFDNYYLRNSYCVIGKSSFFLQVCPGIDIGNDGYGIVNYVDNTHLGLVRVQDLTIGLNVALQSAITDSLLFRGMLGYNYGTGLGNSGYLTSKNNSSYYINAGLEWNVTEHNIVNILGELKERNAKVSGPIGSVTDSWQTDSSTLGGRLGYIRSF